MTDQPEVGIDLVVAERLAGFGRLELGGQLEVVAAPAQGRLHDLPGSARAGAGVADIEALALDVIDVLDVGIAPRQHGHRLGMNREDGPQVLELALVLELRGAVVGVVLPIGLGDAELELATANGVDVVDRATGRFDGTANAVLFAVLVDQTADGAAGGIVHTRDTTGADGDEALLGGRCRLRGRKAKTRHQGERCRGTEEFPHVLFASCLTSLDCERTCRPFVAAEQSRFLSGFTPEARMLAAPSGGRNPHLCQHDKASRR